MRTNVNCIFMISDIVQGCQSFKWDTSAVPETAEVFVAKFVQTSSEMAMTLATKTKHILK